MKLTIDTSTWKSSTQAKTTKVLRKTGEKVESAGQKLKDYANKPIVTIGG